MKRSELKEFIKGEIVTSLSEASSEDVDNQKELNKELEKTAKLSKDLGLEEANPKGEDFTYDYEDIGQFYLEGFGKEHTLTQDQLGKLGKTITKRFYDGDIKKAYDDVYKTSQNAAAKRLADQGQLKNPRYVDGTSINEEAGDDDDVDAKAIKAAKGARGKHKKLDLAVKALKNITTEMKSLARDYSKADGVEKEKIKDQLKLKTPKKKELEALVTQLEKNVV